MSLLHSLAASLLVAELPKGDAQSGPAAAFALVADASAAPKLQRASSPLRKHKRKAAAPNRAGVAEEPVPLSSADEDEWELESRASKERRGSASPDPVSSLTAATRPQRPQRAAAAPQPAMPAAPLGPEQLAAVFEQSALAAAPPPPFLGAAAAATGSAKVCVQCGTSTTPMWRTVNGLTYCNADGLRLKRKLGLL